MVNLLEAMKSLGDATRFRILEVLLAHPSCVTSLAKHLDVSESAVSQHLKILREAGLVRGEKKGYWTHYSVNRNALRQISHELERIASEPEHSCCRCGDSPVDHDDNQSRKELCEDV
ncbi:MAG: metalloregulator ArsR/SmtB family transcription factor [Firmicutes bacterium]|jgi:DNA-binding transcriptional ArsR family regulator|nr:metalloregulator ArsR/SmtB family transcription factor [Bacillota bacterium]